MNQEVEMKDAQAPAPSHSVSSVSAPSTLQHLKDITALIETGAYAKEMRRVVRAVRLTIMLRRKLTASTISAFLTFALTPGSEAHSKLSSYLPKIVKMLIVVNGGAVRKIKSRFRGKRRERTGDEE